MNHLSSLAFKDFNFGGAAEPAQKIAFSYTSGSGHLQQGAWECGPGEFELSFAWDETVFVLEGRAEVENLFTGEKISLEPSCLFQFEKGSRWKWTIPWKFKKIFTIVDV